ncbi:cysteine hydrolase family protein [Methanobacterium sp. BAmetb5]|uniref:cysteine hydrolase family protein n=1 Tax=Methanobacterium sp. BAmetb5 TaxID=2025351 RepID=UPI000E7E3196|nr:cysteine hydrolase family protein [Methanobacterium sp. BAmetb5]AXV40286.1 MAG: isochorismatase [Methanobacterium sp. BAmetb5]
MKRALLVIDVQEEYFSGKLPVTYPPESLENILKVMDTAQDQKIPITIVQHTATAENAETFVKGTPGWELIQEVSKRPYDHLVEKTLPGSFTSTDLEIWLRERNINTVTISGYMSQMCCDTTARQAFHRGFKVEFLSDATGTLNVANYAGKVTGKELHRAILVTQAMRFSEVLNTTDWMARLE